MRIVYMNYLQVEKWGVVVQLEIDRTVGRDIGGNSASYTYTGLELKIDRMAGRDGGDCSASYIPALQLGSRYRSNSR